MKIHFAVKVKIHFVPLLETKILSALWAKVKKENAAGPKLVTLHMRRMPR